MTNNKQYYQQLLRKYETKQPAERWSTKTKTQHAKETRKTIYKHFAERIMSPDNLNIKGDQRQHAFWIIENIDLQELHRQLSAEAIILSICYYVKKLFNPNTRFEAYSIFKTYDLTLEQVCLIICRIAKFAFHKSYLVPVESDKYNHEILCKNGGKL